MPEPKGRSKITVYIPTQLRSQIDASADELGQTLSVWLERACKRQLEALSARD